MSTLSEAALSYAAAGNPVFPCEAGGKRPLASRGFKDATRNPRVLAAWWERNPEANIGMPVPDGTVIIDVDHRNGGFIPEGLPSTRTVVTPNGGYHLYYRVDHDAGDRLVGRWPGVKGVDVKAAGKGYVLVPPSRVWVQAADRQHAVLKSYVLRGAGDVKPLPEWAMKLLVKPDRLTRDVVVGRRRFFPWETGSRPGLSYLAKALETMRAAEEGTRNNTLFRVTASVLGVVDQGDLDEDAALTQLRDAALATGLDYSEVMAAMHSAYETR